MQINEVALNSCGSEKYLQREFRTREEISFSCRGCALSGGTQGLAKEMGRPGLGHPSLVWLSVLVG